MAENSDDPLTAEDTPRKYASVEKAAPSRRISLKRREREDEEDNMAKDKGGNGKHKTNGKKAAAVEAKVKACWCGCGGETKSRFVQGHDARYYSWLKNVDRGKLDFNKLPKHVQKDLGDKKGVRAALKEHFKNYAG